MDRLVVFLNGGRGLNVILAAMAAGHRIETVFVPKKLLHDVTDSCKEMGVRSAVADNVNDPDFRAQLRSMDPKLAIIAGFPTIFQRQTYEIPEFGTINLHAGRLPEYRGGSPLNWQILAGEPEAGISVIRVNDGIDSGPVLADGTFPIEPTDDIASVHEKANHLFCRLVVDVIAKLESGRLQPRVQDEARARYWHQRTAADGRIMFHQMTAVTVHNLIRAVARPYPGAYAFLGDTAVKVFAATMPSLDVRGVPGRVVWLQGQGPHVICADRALLLTDYVIEGRPGAKLPHGALLG